jgi:hypothetical protein
MAVKSFFILSILSVLIACSLNTFGQTSHRDTSFFLKEKDHLIYIEPFKNSEKYKIISDFSFAEFQQENYEEQLKQFESAEISIKKFPLGSFPRQWLNIHMYKQKPYAYYPCDFLNYSGLVFTDSTLLEISGEGPQVSPLVSFKKISSKKFKAVAKGREMIFYFTAISGKNVVVVENYYSDGDASISIPIYQLMVPVSEITSIPLIVNDCINNKTFEFDFDYPDFKKFIPKK